MLHPAKIIRRVKWLDGNTFPGASLLQVNGDGSITATNPETDPFNANPGNKGVVSTVSDVDMFTFTAGAGTIDLSVTPSWAGYYRSSGGRGTNLDVQATLYDLGGNVLASSDPTDETNARVVASVSGGDYYLAVTGVGNTISPYTAYGSEGQYFITGSVPVGTVEPDTTPPNPDPMTWAASPTATGPNSMDMTASTATDDTGGAVQYYFACVSGGAGCADSGWTSSSSHTATGLAAETSYTWQVKARDLAGNETAYSSSASATTDAEPPAPTAPNAPSNLAIADGAGGTAQLSWQDNGDNETGFRVVRESWHPKRKRWQSTTEVASLPADTGSYTDNSGTGLYRYYVEAVNSVGSAATAWVEVTVTDSSSGGGNTCKGGPKKCP